MSESKSCHSIHKIILMCIRQLTATAPSTLLFSFPLPLGRGSASTLRSFLGRFSSRMTGDFAALGGDV